MVCPKCRSNNINKTTIQIFAKEKRDIPVLPKIPRKGEVKPQYPEMPKETVLRALQHAYDECIAGGFEWKDRAKAIPLVVKHLTTEGREHNYEVPRNMYRHYIETPLEELVVFKH